MIRLTTICLLVVLCWSSVSVAIPVNPDAPDEIAALYLPDHNMSVRILRTNGEVWELDNDTWTWEHSQFFSVPVPVSEIADWFPASFQTHSGDVWFRRYGTGETWEIVPPTPWGGSPVKETSLGSVKTMFE